MSILAIDAGTTGCDRVVVVRRRTDRGPRLPGVPPALPAAGLGRARAGGDLAGHARGDPGGASTQVEAGRDLAGIGITNQRETDRAVGPRDRSARRAARSSGRTGAPPTSAHGCASEGHEDRVRELTGLRLDPYFSGTKLTWLAEHEPRTWALVRSGRYAVGHRRLLPDRPDDPRHLARHRRLQRLAARCCSTSRRGDWSDELLRALRRAARRAARARAQLGRGRAHRPEGVPRPRRCRSPGIAGDQQAALFGQTCFDVGRLQVHLRHRLVHPHQHRHRRWCARDAGLLSHRGLALPDGEHDLRPRGRDLRDRRRRAVAA